jgi:hypothetical protein
MSRPTKQEAKEPHTQVNNSAMSQLAKYNNEKRPAIFLSLPHELRQQILFLALDKTFASILTRLKLRTKN